MSQIPPYLRGYRQALRDVQHSVLLYRQTTSGPSSALLALSVAADCISTPLRQLRETGVAALPETAREQMAVVSTSQLDYIRGYEAGFDEGKKIVAGWGREMNDPAAREAIANAVTKLQQLGTSD